MASEISKTQIDRLGERLKKGNITEADLRLLDSYRRSFTEAYEIVMGKIREELKLEPTGRPAKSTTSISDKLRRESIRLTQIQDIAGCRLIVTDIANQETVVEALKNLFEQTTIVDRREQPSHGYRAVHVIARCDNKLIEIQVRTALQHLWAELSEKFSDVVDSAIKYGGGDKTSQSILAKLSSLVADEESNEMQFEDIQPQLFQLSSSTRLTDNHKRRITAVQERLKSVVPALLDSMRQEVSKLLQNIIKDVEKLKGENDDLSG